MIPAPIKLADTSMEEQFDMEGAVMKAIKEVEQTTNSSAYNRLARKIRWKTKRFEGSLERNKTRLRDDRYKNHR